MASIPLIPILWDTGGNELRLCMQSAQNITDIKDNQEMAANVTTISIFFKLIKLFKKRKVEICMQDLHSDL